MQTRRQFIRNTAAIAGAVATFPESIQRALAIDPVPGSSFLDAEHVVILMQENRSFDHCFGSLQGVRGFSDPRAFTSRRQSRLVPDPTTAGDSLRPVSARHQSDDTHVDGIAAAYMGRPDRRSQRRASMTNGSSPSTRIRTTNMPLTLGHYTRDDIPFYYALADAFTVCDQDFCSSLTGTTANRLLSGPARSARTQTEIRPCRTRNGYGKGANWRHFPNGFEETASPGGSIRTKSVSIPGLRDDEAAWLGGFSDNPIEWFTQYNIRFAGSRRTYLTANCSPRRRSAILQK